MRQIYYNIVLVGSKNCDFLCKITFYSYSKHSATFWCQLEVWIQEDRSPTKQKRQRVSPFNSETQDRPNIDLIIVVIAGHEMKVQCMHWMLFESGCERNNQSIDQFPFNG